MRKFKVQVNGIPYDVEIEEVGGAAAPAPAPAAVSAPVSAPAAPASPVAPAAPAPAPAATGGEPINAPLPGTVLEVKVSAGQSVSKGDVLFVLEAMKMENEILAAHDGVIASVNAQKGASVNSGDVLASFK